MNETEDTTQSVSVPGVPDAVEKLSTDVMQVSEQMVLLTWLAFGIAAFCLHKLLWKPILKVVETREQSISDALDGADRARKQRSDDELRSRQIVDQATDRARSITDQATRETTAMLAHADQEAKALAQRRMADAEREIEMEQCRAVEAVRQDAAKNIGDLVERLLLKNLTEEQKRAYQTDILSEVKL